MVEAEAKGEAEAEAEAKQRHDNQSGQTIHCLLFLSCIVLCLMLGFVKVSAKEGKKKIAGVFLCIGANTGDKKEMANFFSDCLIQKWALY